MRAVVQKVESANVSVDGKVLGQIKQGLLVYLGIMSEDTQEDIDWLVNKIVNMRIFADENYKMNNSVLDINGSALVISQFTLFASTKKGNRPSFLQAAKPDIAVPLYETFVKCMHNQIPVATGKFGAHMKVDYINDGPVTIIIDTKHKE